MVKNIWILFLEVCLSFIAISYNSINLLHRIPVMKPSDSHDPYTEDSNWIERLFEESSILSWHPYDIALHFRDYGTKVYEHETISNCSGKIYYQLTFGRHIKSIAGIGQLTRTITVRTKEALEESDSSSAPKEKGKPHDGIRIWRSRGKWQQQTIERMDILCM